MTKSREQTLFTKNFSGRSFLQTQRYRTNTFLNMDEESLGIPHHGELQSITDDHDLKHEPRKFMT